ncbi:hypothetical protein BJ165DRAFT_1517872 [Panaeolus papilionaceus]|nr:hypothetical protein BJ165DRAFT_1517872 [Panaeolus papilionaceus]
MRADSSVSCSLHTQLKHGKKIVLFALNTIYDVQTLLNEKIQPSGLNHAQRVNGRQNEHIQPHQRLHPQYPVIQQ